MGEKFLDKVYTAKDADGTRKLYDAWAKSYEDEVGAEGYATPRRCAEALASVSCAGYESCAEDSAEPVPRAWPTTLIPSAAGH